MTQVVRIKINADKQAFNVAMENECNIRLAAGLKLVSAFALNDDIVLVFQS